jgi:copper chaperone NosL
MRRPALALALLASAVAIGCLRGRVAPASLDTENEACRFCRMNVTQRRFAAQIVAPAEEPLFFDDVGCLRDYLRREGAQPAGAIAYVADHRTEEWVLADTAVYTRISGETPMGSHLIAHRHADSRALDPAARNGTPVPSGDIFGPGGPAPSHRRNREET